MAASFSATKYDANPALAPTDWLPPVKFDPPVAAAFTVIDPLKFSAVWATAWDHALSVRSGPGHVLVASEPLDDDPAWSGVPDRHLVVARPGEHHLIPLGSS